MKQHALAIATNIINDDTPGSYRQSLASKLAHFADVAKRYNSISVVASEYLEASNSGLDGFYCIPKIVARWVVQMCDLANERANNRTTMRITRSFLPKAITAFDFPRSSSFFDADPTMESGQDFFSASVSDLTVWTLDHFDFELLHSSLNKAVQDVEQAGFKSAADHIRRDLGLQTWVEIEIKKQRNYYLLNFSLSDDQYNNTRQLESLKKAANTFEIESGYDGFSECVTGVIAAIAAKNPQGFLFDHKVPSRTKIMPKPGQPNVKATFYNRKIVFAFYEPVFESLISFVRVFSDNDQNKLNIRIK